MSLSGRKSFAQRGPEQREPADAVGTGERGEEAVVDGQAGQQLHAVHDAAHGGRELSWLSDGWAWTA